MQERGTIMKQDRRSTKLSAAQKKKLIIIIAAAVVLITAAVVILRKSVSEKYGKKDDAEILSAEVTRGSISTSVSGSGQLSDDDVETLDIPDGVELEEIKAVRGSKVEAGDLLATVDLNTVMLAMSTVSDELDTLDDEINSAVSDSVSSYISSSVSGRVKKIYAAAGEPVSEDEGEDTGEGGTTEPGGSEEPSNPDPVEPSPEPGDGKTTEKFGKVTAVDEEAGTVTVRLTDGSDLTLDAAELETLGASQISVGNILALGYDESGTLVSVTVYSSGGQDDPTGGGEMPSGGMGGGGMSGGTASAEDDIPKDYIMDETELCTLTDYDTAEITLTVDELDIAQLSIGQAVTVTLDALPGQSFDGEITEIDPNGENSGGSTKYSVTVTLPRTEDMLTGMNAAVRVQLRENDGRLLIPLAAVQEDANGIYVCTGYDKSSDEATDPIEITTGLSDGENVEVLSGLSEGDTVYYRYADTLEYSFVK